MASASSSIKGDSESRGRYVDEKASTVPVWVYRGG